MIDDKSCFKGRPFLTEKGAAKGKKSRSSPFMQLQQNLSVKFCKTQPWICIFWHCLGQEFPNGYVCTTESIYRHLGVGAQNQDLLPLLVQKKWGDLSRRSFTQFSSQKHLHNDFWAGGAEGGHLSNFFCIRYFLYAFMLCKIFQDQLFHGW